MASRILIADDDGATRVALRRALHDHGYEVREASGRDELTAALQAERPDLLLLDLVMPGDDGLAVLRELKVHDAWRDLPVVMMSSRGSEDVVERCFGLGACDFLRKPVRPRELLARVQHQLRSRGRCASRSGRCASWNRS